MLDRRICHRRDTSNLILTRVRPSIWIPTIEVVWTVLTFSLSRCETATQIYVLRFFIGLAESGFYPGMQYVIGSWYRSDELAKRSCIFHTSSAIASMFSGYLMAAVYHLDGVGGFKGWQWLFIVDGIISLPIAVAGYFVLPDLPETTRARYLTEDVCRLFIQCIHWLILPSRRRYSSKRAWLLKDETTGLPTQRRSLPRSSSHGISIS